jgi:hypothetical protein
MINNLTSYFKPDGTPTVEGLRLLGDLERRVKAAEGKLSAIAAITGPSGGATIDTQARTAINAIIAGAG